MQVTFGDLMNKLEGNDNAYQTTSGYVVHKVEPKANADNNEKKEFNEILKDKKKKSKNSSKKEHKTKKLEPDILDSFSCYEYPKYVRR
jgi:hypothetical protein